MKLWLVLVAGCWTSSQPAPAPVSNTVAPGPPQPKAGEAKVVQRTNTGGVIELAGDRGAAMQDASDEMNQHCGPNNYTITQEGEEAVGSDAVAGQPVRIETAWRVHYLCNGAP